MAAVADRLFADVQPQGVISLGKGKWVTLPIRYFDVATCGGRFSADAEAVRRALPSPRLAPVACAPGRAEVILSAYDVRQWDLDPCREVGVWIPVVDRGTDGAGARSGLYCSFLPLTSEEGLIAGVEGWGFPKFLAEIAIEERANRLTCRVAVDDQEVLTLSVEPGSPAPTPEPTELNVYTVQGDEVLSCRIAAAWRDGVRAGAGGAWLTLGDHPRAEALRRLQIAPEAIGHHREPGRILLLYGPDERFPR